MTLPGRETWPDGAPLVRWTLLQTRKACSTVANKCRHRGHELLSHVDVMPR